MYKIIDDWHATYQSKKDAQKALRAYFTGNENRVAQFEPPMGVPDRIRQFPGDDEYTKLRNYRAWNGMEIDENRRKRRR